MKKKVILQDKDYEFPYHFIPKFKKNFSLIANWSWGKQYTSVIEFILEKIKKNTKTIKSIADIGCGEGRLVKEMSNIFINKKIVGIDTSIRAINLARSLNPELNFTNHDLLNKKIKEKFDLITLIEVLEHIPINQLKHFIKSLHGLLKKNGKIFITVPHKNKKKNKKHFQHFTNKSLINHFKNGFEILEIKNIQRDDKILSILNFLMFNNFWIINNNFLNNIFYRFYKKKYFFSDEKQCGRIYLEIKKKDK